MAYVIECSGLVKRYPGFTLGPLDINVETGTVTGLVGSNGAGKTTFIKLLLGLTSFDSGQISLFGNHIDCPENLSASIKRRIGVVFDTCPFPTSTRVDDAMRVGRAAYRSWDDKLFKDLATSFKLDPKKEIQKLSRGMGMKLSIAFALAHHPDLLILDEATAGLDPLARDEVLDILRSFMLDGEHTILMSTHITSDLEKLADTVICIDDGQICFSAQKDAICNEAGIARCRADQVEAIAANWEGAPTDLHVLKHAYGTDLLIPDRFAFKKAFPDIPIDRITIDEYMNLILKGETL